ncbi:hypothetical protein ACHAXH_003732 [Discostella pseudostelligera]
MPTSISTCRRRRIMALAAVVASSSSSLIFMLLTSTAESFVLSSTSSSSPSSFLFTTSSSSTLISSATTSLSCAAFNNDDNNNSHNRESTTSLNYKNDKQIHDEQRQSSSSPTIKAAKSSSKPPKIHPTSGGRITLVGAGPGSPDLLTISAHRIITDPNNLIIVDRLVSAEIISLVSGEYKVANKHPGCAEMAQQEIYEWCKEGIMNGRHVVRLKIGDPFVFGRGGEEVLEFREFGVEPSIIPGVSAAFSAPLLGSIPVTHRGISNQVVMCTGYGREGTSPDLIQYHKEQTVVFLMAVGRLRSLCDNLVTKAHYPKETPVGIVERAGCPDQRTIVGNMETIADLAERYNVKPPSTIVVGEVVNVLLTEDDFGMVAEMEEHHRREGLVVVQSNTI